MAESALNTLAVISDASYAWGVIGQHTAYLQDRIRRDPLSVRKLRCLFLKLKSILEMPLLRISQHESSAGPGHSSTFHLNLSRFCD